MADNKISLDPELITPHDTDYLPIVDESGSTPVNKKIQVSNLLSTVVANITTLDSQVTALMAGVLSGSLDVLGSGTFSEGTTTPGLHLGLLTGNNPRLLFATGNAAQTWEIDNSAGTLRFYVPGTVKALLSSAGSWLTGGYTRVGSLVAPTNTSNGDLTANRAFFLTSLFVGGQSVATSTLQSGGSFGLPLVKKTANYTITANDVTVIASGSGTTITLPTAVGCNGRIYIIKRVDGSNTITVATTSSQTIDGSTTVSLSSNFQTLRVQSDGANWSAI